MMTPCSFSDKPCTRNTLAHVCSRANNVPKFHGDDKAPFPSMPESETLGHIRHADPDLVRVNGPFTGMSRAHPRARVSAPRPRMAPCLGTPPRHMRHAALCAPPRSAKMVPHAENKRVFATSVGPVPGFLGRGAAAPRTPRTCRRQSLLTLTPVLGIILPSVLPLFQNQVSPQWIALFGRDPVRPLNSASNLFFMASAAWESHCTATRPL